MIIHLRPARHHWHRLLFLGLLCASMLISACDDYNIVEPRFYSEDDVVEFGECGVDLYELTGFSVDACWWSEGSDRMLFIAIAVVDSGPAKLTILNSAGAVDTVLYERPTLPGVMFLSGGIPWGDREDGVYGLSLQTERNTVVHWFEVK